MLRSSAGCIPDCLAKTRRALERLDHEVVRDVAREAEVDGGVDQRLHHQEDVGRPGARHRGGHRHHLLVVDLDLVAERSEQRGGLGALLGRRLRRGVPHGHPAAEAGRRVGHAPDDLVVAEDAGQGRGRRAGQHAQDELAARQVRADLAADLGQHLGLDPEAGSRRRRRPPRRSRPPSGCRTRGRAARAAPGVDGWPRPARAGPGCRAGCPRSSPRPSRRSRRSRSWNSPRGDIARSIAGRSPALRPSAGWAGGA